MRKKYIIIGSLIVISIMLITIFAISASAENNTTGSTKEIEDEKTLVKMAASISRGKAENDKVNKETLEEELNRYAGSGVTTVTEQSSDILIVKYTASGREYPININSGYIESTTPYLPSGFTYLPSTDLDTGLVIQDSLGNQYVWVELPRTTEVYPNAGLSIISFTDAEYESIENDLHTYTSVYRNSTTYTDEWYSEAQHGFASADEYNALKNKMLKSVYQNGGFYVGRYETGTTTTRTSSSSTLTTPVIQVNAYPYNNVTNKQAQTLASGMESGEYTSSLMFGVQWDLVLKYLETKGATQSELNSDSTEWGNYSNNTYNITNTSAKYYSTSWAGAPYDKTASGSILLSTGASSEFCKQEIYDIAGNVYEWTLEKSDSASAPSALRGGDYLKDGAYYTANYRYYYRVSFGPRYFGFRVSLF